ncbi:MAG: MFS transporter [Hyphomicrobiales bacterium]|nr:MFS transporter [Hyphomicrobiales bacterium]MCP5371884.1 MFS transporter [Hyphomicrobiales bacterium]
MRQTILSVMSLLLGTALVYLGNGVLGTLLGVRMAQIDFGAIVAGIVMAAYFAGVVAGTFYGRSLIAGVGHIRAFSAFASCFSAAVLAHPFLVDPTAWGVLRFVEGVCLSGLSMCTESWLNARAGNEYRGRVLSIYMIVLYGAQGGGQFLLFLPDPSGFGLFVAASILTSIALVPVAISKVDAPPLPDASRVGMREMYRASPTSVVAAFVSGLTLGAVYGLLPFVTLRLGMDETGTAQVMGALIVGGVLLQWPLGRLSDHMDRRKVLLAVTAVIGITSAALALAAGAGGPWMLILVPFFGGVLFTLYPLALAYAGDHVAPEKLVQANGTMILTYGVGAAIGPVAASGLMQAVGPRGLFMFDAAVAAAAVVFTLWRIGQRPSMPTEEQSPFQPVPRTSPVAAEMDPRAETDEPELDLARPRTGG